MKTGIIYKAVNKINGKCYVGQTVQKINRRKQRHYRDSKTEDHHFSRALRKYKKSDWKWEIIHDNVPKINLNLLEIWNIAVYDSYENGYNSTTGGDGAGHKCSDETKKKLSKANKGRKHTEESKKNMSEGSKGKKHTKETKEKMSESRKGKKLKPFSEEHKRKLSEVFRGEKHPQSKLTWEKVREIRAKYIPWKYSYLKLAKEYGVGKTTIENIINNKKWKT